MKEKTGDNGVYMAAFVFKGIYTLQNYCDTIQDR